MSGRKVLIKVETNKSQWRGECGSPLFFLTKRTVQANMCG
jgi:hypothetical protein